MTYALSASGWGASRPPWSLVLLALRLRRRRQRSRRWLPSCRGASGPPLSRLRRPWATTKPVPVDEDDDAAAASDSGGDRDGDVGVDISRSNCVGGETRAGFAWRRSRRWPPPRLPSHRRSWVAGDRRRPLARPGNQRRAASPCCGGTRLTGPPPTPRFSSKAVIGRRRRRWDCPSCWKKRGAKLSAASLADCYVFVRRTRQRPVSAPAVGPRHSRNSARIACVAVTSSRRLGACGSQGKY